MPPRERSGAGKTARSRNRRQHDRPVRTARHAAHAAHPADRGRGLPGRRGHRRARGHDPQERILGLPGPATPPTSRFCARSNTPPARPPTTASPRSSRAPATCAPIRPRRRRRRTWSRCSPTSPAFSARWTTPQRTCPCSSRATAARRSCSPRSPTANARPPPSNTSVPLLASANVRLGGSDVAFAEINKRTSSDLARAEMFALPILLAALLLGLPRADRRRAAAARGRVRDRDHVPAAAPDRPVRGPVGVRRQPRHRRWPGPGHRLQPVHSLALPRGARARPGHARGDPPHAADRWAHRPVRLA